MDPSDHLDIDTSRYFTVEKEVMCDIMNHVNNTNQNLVCRWFWRLLLLSHNKLQLSLFNIRMIIALFLDIYCIHFALGNFFSIYLWRNATILRQKLKLHILIRIVYWFHLWLNYVLQKNPFTYSTGNLQILLPIILCKK